MNIPVINFPGIDMTVVRTMTPSEMASEFPMYTKLFDAVKEVMGDGASAMLPDQYPMVQRGLDNMYTIEHALKHNDHNLVLRTLSSVVDMIVVPIVNAAVGEYGHAVSDYEIREMRVVGKKFARTTVRQALARMY